MKEQSFRQITVNERVALETLLPPNTLSTDKTQNVAFAGDKWLQGPTPQLVARPNTTAEVAGIFRFANEREIPVTTRGAGWGLVGGAVSNAGGILISLDRMTAIREISTTDFIAEVEAGVITAHLQALCKERGLFYPPDPASAAHCTLGGNIAANAGGPRCLKYGVTRNYVLGLEVVLANGTILNLGGRTHKNVTGFDLLGLFVGSEGMLGVVTAATLKLLPHPQTRAAIAAVFPNTESAARTTQIIFEAGILPSACELADEFTYRSLQRSVGIRETNGAHLLVEVDGSAVAVKAEIAEVQAVFEKAGAISLMPAHTEVEVESLWDVRRRFSEALTASRNIRLNEDIVIPRGRLVDLVRFSQGLSRKYNVDISCFGHAGDGNIHVNLMLDEVGESEAILDELFAQVLAWDGALTGEHGIGLAKTRWWPQAIPPEVHTANENLKKHFDPRGILNPGKWI